MYTTLAFLALLGTPYIYIYTYDISRLRVTEHVMISARKVYKTVRKTNDNIFMDKY